MVWKRVLSFSCRSRLRQGWLHIDPFDSYQPNFEDWVEDCYKGTRHVWGILKCHRYDFIGENLTNPWVELYEELYVSKEKRLYPNLLYSKLVHRFTFEEPMFWSKTSRKYWGFEDSKGKVGFNLFVSEWMIPGSWQDPRPLSGPYSTYSEVWNIFNIGSFHSM